MNNKKAQINRESLLWVYRFILIAFIVVVYVVIIMSYYTNVYDVRPAEATLLANRVIDCISEKGVVDIDKFNSEEIKSCSDINDEEYVKLVLKKDSDSETLSLSVGNSEIWPLCNLKGNAPFCLNQKYYILVDDKGAILDLNVGILKIKENIK